MAQSEHLDKAEAALRELRDYDDWDEPTARTDVHLHMHSEHEIPAPESVAPAKKLKGGLVAIGTGIGVALLGGLATLLQRCGH